MHVMHVINDFVVLDNLADGTESFCSASVCMVWWIAQIKIDTEQANLIWYCCKSNESHVFLCRTANNKSDKPLQSVTKGLDVSKTLSLFEERTGSSFSFDPYWMIASFLYFIISISVCWTSFNYFQFSLEITICHWTLENVLDATPVSKY